MALPRRLGLGALLAASAASLACTPSAALAPAAPPTINGHAVVLDQNEKLLSWSRAESPYADVVRLAWSAMKTRFPVQPNGYKTYFTFSRFDPETGEGVYWPHNPASLYAMLSESALEWYAYSGDHEVIELVREALDHMLDHGLTPLSWDWSSVPFSSGEPSEPDYRGADDEWCDWCGRGDGVGVLEPDKIAELGYAYARFWELTDDERYRDEAVACGNALARYVRDGDDRRSPWPFRVYAKNNVEREAYTADVLPAVELFDELVHLGLGDAAAYQRARDAAWSWLMDYPMQNDGWSGYFEDIPIFTDPQDNPTQYIPLQLARYLLEHPDADPGWKDHAAHLLAWVKENFGDDANDQLGVQYGAQVLSEQRADMAKMGSHTARYAAVSARFFEKTGDASARENAYRSFNWATYMCDENGIVSVSEDRNEGWWFSDGYGDYMRQFMVGIAAVPEWAPAHEDHLLWTTSVARNVSYEPGRIHYETFDDAAEELLRLTRRPTAVTAGDATLALRDDLSAEGYTLEASRAGGFVVRVRHDTSGDIAVSLDPTAARPPQSTPATAQGLGARKGCAVAAVGSRGASAASVYAAAVALLSLAVARRRRRRLAPKRHH